ncbi:MAG: hypothetical protein ACP5NX_03375 [Candidatus Bilamarchaeaceae archaeon]
MRGYLNFILVFLFSLILFLLLQQSLMISGYSKERALVLRNAKYYDLNVKENVIELVREGAEEGLRNYKLLALVREERLDPFKAEEAAEEGAYAKLLLAEGLKYEDYALEFRCGREPGLGNCRKLIEVRIDTAKFEIGSVRIGNGDDVLGFTLSSEKFNITKDGYLPPEPGVFEARG